MNQERIKELLENIRDGKVSVDRALERLRNLPFEDIGVAKLDHHRSLRTGYPEVVYCEGKSIEQIGSIAKVYVERRVNMLLTRAGDEVFRIVRQIEPGAEYNSEARCIWKTYDPLPECERPVVVVAAGTSDIGVAEEACVTAGTMGCRVEKQYDIGIAGIHRLLGVSEIFEKAGAIVVVAGMEGALASVVGGLTSRPVIAVPTSVGYGSAFGGLAALLGMLNTCAPGVAVMNIDNGFGAGYFAAVVCRDSCADK